MPFLPLMKLDYIELSCHFSFYERRFWWGIFAIGSVMGLTLCFFALLPWWCALFWFAHWTSIWNGLRGCHQNGVCRVICCKNGFWRWLNDSDPAAEFEVRARWLTPFCLILKTTDPQKPYWWIWRDGCDEHTFRQFSLWSRYV